MRKEKEKEKGRKEAGQVRATQAWYILTRSSDVTTPTQDAKIAAELPEGVELQYTRKDDDAEVGPLLPHKTRPAASVHLHPQCAE